MGIQWRAWEAEPQFGGRTYRACAANPTRSVPKQYYLIRFSATKPAGTVLETVINGGAQARDFPGCIQKYSPHANFEFCVRALPR